MVVKQLGLCISLIMNNFKLIMQNTAYVTL
jgi:hypothetical protein